uniref:non-specific serine/threonine protein kinase n=1 Tax=Strigamia maritima TaxID=126957 RepID=T1JJ02_STRMM
MRNIQKVIGFTKENLEKLNAKFSHFKHPPSIYLMEYEELTSKLDALQLEEQKLLEQLSDTSNGRASPEMWEMDSECVNINNLNPSVDSGINITVDDSSITTPKSPLKSVLRADLPNLQHTTVQVKPGQTIKDALNKAMKLRKLKTEMCSVYIKGETRGLIEWEADISVLHGRDIEVKIIDAFSITTSISHNFVRKTFFSLVFCEYCRGLLFHGFRCQTCGYRFHQRCASGVPTLCQQVGVENNNYRHLLAMNHPGTLYPGQSQMSSAGGSNRMLSPPQPVSRQNPPPLGQRDRSTSAPNVCYSIVSNNIDTSQLNDFPFRLRSNFTSNSGTSNALLTSQFSANQIAAGSPTKQIQSAQASPTNTLRPLRPRAKSADESGKKIKPPRESIDDWEIPMNEILIGPRIGSGSFGTVYKGHWHGKYTK